MDLLTRLKTDTRARHQQTETVLFADKLGDGTLLPADYAQLLVVHYRFYQALETAVAGQALFFSGYDHEARRKTPWLVTDLNQTGTPLPAPAPDLFTGWTGYQLLGALYVAEGATLGGRVIAAALRRTPGLSNLVLHFFGGYGEQTGPRWKAFGLYLTNRADGHDSLLVEAADRAFGYFEQLAQEATVPVPTS